MASEASERVITLLQELKMLKEQNQDYESNPSEDGREEHLLRQKRHEEITDEIKAVARIKEAE
ncbi:MAG TPA: hypothetical protein VGM18_08945 [Candidatus Sulfotelmatobacter sp.]|jgi:hypothetical protein